MNYERFTQLELTKRLYGDGWRETWIPDFQRWKSINYNHSFEDGLSGGVYYIQCIPENKIYIGSSTWIGNRIKQHFGDLGAKRHNNKNLQNVFDLYGVEKFKWDIFEFCENSVLSDREQFWIDSYSEDVLYNKTKRANRNENDIPITILEANKYLNLELSENIICHLTKDHYKLKLSTKFDYTDIYKFYINEEKKYIVTWENDRNMNWKQWSQKFDDERTIRRLIKTKGLEFYFPRITHTYDSENNRWVIGNANL